MLFNQLEILQHFPIDLSASDPIKTCSQLADAAVVVVVVVYQLLLISPLLFFYRSAQGWKIKLGMSRKAIISVHFR